LAKATEKRIYLRPSIVVHPAPCTLLPAPCVNSIERSGNAENGLGNLIRRRRSWKSRPKPKASR